MERTDVTTTPDLIAALALTVEPVHRLRPPMQRALIWLTIAAAVLIALTFARGLRADLPERLTDGSFTLALVGAVTTGVLAAVAAFFLSMPDRSRAWALLPLPALAVWGATIGYGCLTDWVSVGSEGIKLGVAFECFVTVILAGGPLTLALLAMLRHVAALRPMHALIAAGLAVAALTSAALSLFHDLDATVMVLVWNVGLTASVVLASGMFGNRILTWTWRSFGRLAQS